MTKAQNRLSRPSNFTGYYRWRHDMQGADERPPPGGEIGQYAIGDFGADPKKANKMLVNTRIPAGRALDFRCETDWRMALRPDRRDSRAGWSRGYGRGAT